MATATQVHRICPICEATCGLELTVEDGRVTKIRGDKEDVFSEGFVCPKGVALSELHEDPDRLKTPLIRNSDGSFREASYEEAFALIDEKLNGIIREHGKDAVGIYVGNPAAHSAELAVYGSAFNKALGSRNRFSASTVDQMPKQVAVAHMFGAALSVPIPDIDRTQYMMIMGANPLVSGGSLMTAPNYPERLKRIQQRGGKVVVVDPARTKTAVAADEHVAIRPGKDPHFLLGIVHTLFEENLVEIGRLEEFVSGIEEVREIAKDFSPEVAADHCGIPAEDIRRFAREIAAADGACVYARIGTCTQEFGTLASWLPEVIHVLTGNLDREGGAMFPLAPGSQTNAKGESGKGRGMRFGRSKSRVSGYPETLGEYPSAAMAEEILTPGKGQIRAMVTIAGNPLVSTANIDQLNRAFESLEFMVSLDIYLNETTRHADVILPGLSPLEHCHYDIAFPQLAIQNHARYSPTLFDPPEGQLAEWQTLLQLSGIVSGMGPKAPLAALDDYMIRQAIAQELKVPHSPIAGRETDEIVDALKPRVGIERILDFLMRVGPYGEGFGKDSDGLSLDKLEANPRGISYGAMKPRMPEVLRTPTGKIELAPEGIVCDLPRLTASLEKANGHMVLIGRRHLFTNNSWLGNLKMLQAGKAQCSLLLHPTDASRLGFAEGDRAEITSRVGKVEAPVEITDDIMPGVVSLPHGWGHDAPGVRMEIAEGNPGVNSNILADEKHMDVLSGNLVLNGIPVEVVKAAASARGEREAAGATA